MNIEAVKRILWEDWDPIGVRDMGGHADEYDSYAPMVLLMLQAGETEGEIAEHLFLLAVNQMGLTKRETGVSEFEQRVARKLIGLKAS